MEKEDLRQGTGIYWGCKVGPLTEEEMERLSGRMHGPDRPMRRGVREAFHALTGHNPEVLASRGGFKTPDLGDEEDGEARAAVPEPLAGAIEAEVAKLKQAVEVEIGIVREEQRDLRTERGAFAAASEEKHQQLQTRRDILERFLAQVKEVPGGAG